MSASQQMRSPASASTQDRAGSRKPSKYTSTHGGGNNDCLDIAAALIAGRYGLTPGVAKLIASLASLGGRFI